MKQQSAIIDKPRQKGHISLLSHLYWNVYFQPLFMPLKVTDKAYLTVGLFDGCSKLPRFEGFLLESRYHYRIRRSQLKLVTTATTGGGVLFSSRCPSLHREREILATLGYFVVNIRTFWFTFTGLNNAVVSQNWQISGMKKVL